MRKNMMICVCVVFLLSILRPPVCAHAESNGNNRFNVAVVLDASGSMKWTDKNDLRYQAIRIFLQMLTEQGNVVGGVVFSEGVDASIHPAPINTQADKDRLYDALKAVPAIGGWTNIGIGLETAVQSLLQYGNPDNPSVVLLLSDGNTDMPDNKAFRDSMESQADGIQLARENDVRIYSICLNTDGTADTDEMLRISGSRERFQNLGSANDLSDAFSVFYNMIYDTSTVKLLDEEIPYGGVLETDFPVPGIGVEDINIIIYGNYYNLTITRPDGSPCAVEPVTVGSVTTLKIANLRQGAWQGMWHLSVGGVTGDRIKINMTYNTDMVVDTDVKVVQNQEGDSSDGTVEITATIGSPGQPGPEKGYAGFDAEAVVKNGEDVIARIPMEQDGAKFTVSLPLDEGSYTIQVHISGNNIDKNSPEETIRVTEPEVIPPINHFPEPIPEDLPVVENILVFPGGTTFELDMTTLARDPDGDDLTFTVKNSSFLENTDYTVQNNVLTITQFPLHRSVFTIQATDPDGLSCDVEVILNSRHVALLALLGVAALGLLILILFGIWVWRSMLIAFMGRVDVRDLESSSSVELPGNRGRLRLADFEAASSGLSQSSYFQASGGEYITYVSPWPHRRFYTDISGPVRSVRIDSGIETNIYSDVNHERGITVQFHSTVSEDSDDYSSDPFFYKNSDMGIDDMDDGAFMDSSGDMDEFMD